eukprot:6346118-Amphidinium_carterae.1
MERTRPASLASGRLVTEVVTQAAGRELNCDSHGIYYIPEREFLVTVHGDDFICAGTMEGAVRKDSVQDQEQKTAAIDWNNAQIA